MSVMFRFCGSTNIFLMKYVCIKFSIMAICLGWNISGKNFQDRIVKPLLKTTFKRKDIFLSKKQKNPQPLNELVGEVLGLCSSEMAS